MSLLTYELPADLKPGTWGCSHGNGWLGTQIRNAELKMTQSSKYPNGNRLASWAGHCFIFIGNYNFGTAGYPNVKPAIVEAEWPRVKVSPASAHADAIWAMGQPLTAAQRKLGVISALKQVDMYYDVRAYGWFLLRMYQLRVNHNLAPLFSDPHMRICSGTVVKEQEDMGVDVSELVVAATDSPDFTCPADCMAWGLENGWMSETPLENW